MKRRDRLTAPVNHLLATPTRHPIKAARLLYSPPPLMLRLPIYSVFIVLLSGAVYSYFARKDVVVAASLVLKKDSFTIYANRDGFVSRIIAHENDYVGAGERLAIVQETVMPTGAPARSERLSQSDSERRLGSAATTIENFQDPARALFEYVSVFDGTVIQEHVQRGQFVTAGAPLITLVKESAALEGYAFIDNKDIGSLARGQSVKIKYFAYPYQEYGIAIGRIADIASTPSGLPGKESKYLIRVALQSETIAPPNGSARPLEMGLEGIAEIKTGEKRLIEFLFSPLAHFLGGSQGA